MTEEDLKHYVGVLFLSGYHSLPQQDLYWESCNDVEMSVVYQTISKNKFKTIKNYIHLADNSNFDRQDKYAKILILSVQVTVRPLYDMENKSLKQFGYWHQDYTIDEHMIPYFGMHSARHTMHVKSVRFGYKNLVLARSDGYPYHLISYSSIVVDLVLTCQEGIRNLILDNWYASSKLISLLTAMNIPIICTACGDRINSASITSKSQMKRFPSGNYSYAHNDSIGLHYVQWKDNSVVTMLSNCIGPYPLEKGERLSRKD